MHIVEKLNGSDLKFLGQANSESRLALRRSKNVVTVPVKFDGTNEGKRAVVVLLVLVFSAQARVRRASSHSILHSIRNVL
tara:strand:+ start:181 stop:420 length:240 start_codon:yes stop_codon:yes gene_type:complete